MTTTNNELISRERFKEEPGAADGNWASFIYLFFLPENKRAEVMAEYQPCLTVAGALRHSIQGGRKEARDEITAVSVTLPGN